ncbi:MAG: asparagine synthase (glutamine-hydrolyzing) [Chlorobiaceae bacterium]|nr:asparagine synthase (glutamine-hydrolyzing) [Chlorobiaceae bacterium]
MCGIAGTIGRGLTGRKAWESACSIQSHRGPDGFGEWQGGVGGRHVALAHQRLSILDLSEAGSQPMIHRQTGSILVFNGEIYNFVELRAELEVDGVHFDGHSDTEVLLRGLEYWGIKATLPKLNGMWAFAWVDQRNRNIHLSRDRTGEKPLYYAVRGQRMYFSSELKTMLTMLDEPQSLNPRVILEFLEFGLLDISHKTMFNGIDLLTPGVILTVGLDSPELQYTESPYWVCSQEIRDGIGFPAFVDQLRDVFFRSVRYRLRSDVPVGILLSGGLDSSSIAGAAKYIGADNLKLLSAVSDDARFDESPFIDSVVRHLDWEVTKVRLNQRPEEIFEHMEQATWFMDAPISSFSYIAHYLLMREARNQGITVILSGQGADELLCGYRKYLGFYVQGLLRDRHFARASTVMAQFLHNRTIINQFNWAEAKRYLPAILRSRSDHTYGPALNEISTIRVGLDKKASLNDRQLLDLTSLSVPTLNHTEDRMSMAWSREIRLPFLDPQMIEMLITAPAEYKLNNGWTKYSLRCAMEPFLPAEIVWRKDKKGFINPQGEWLKNELHDDILGRYFHEDAYIFRLGFMNRRALLELYRKYVAQEPEKGTIYFREIFNPLGLEIWLRRYSPFISGLA